MHETQLLQVTPQTLRQRIAEVGLPANVWGSHDGEHPFWALVTEANFEKQVLWVNSMTPKTCFVEHRGAKH